MSYKIVVDSCCDLVEEMKEWENFQIVPLTLEIGDYRILDDENFDQDDFIKRMDANGGLAKSACPAPETFKQAYEGDYDHVFVLTITDKLSGTYNSAVQGKRLYEEENNDSKKIYVFNSLATSGLETIVALEIDRLSKEGKPFEEIVSYIDDYIVNHTALYFCLESLNALKSNGRLFALTARVLEKIRVKLVCRRTTEGNIAPSGQELTMNRAMIKIANLVQAEVNGKDVSNQKLYISYVCNKERAQLVADKIKEKLSFGDVRIIKASGLNSLYASNGGVLVSFSF